MGRTFQTWVYTDDQGNDYNRKAPTDFTTQKTGEVVKIGGSLAAVVNPNMPKALKPRVALCQDEDHVKYRVVCYEPTALLYITVGATFSVYDRDGGAAITVTVYGSEGERTRAKLLTPA